VVGTLQRAGQGCHRKVGPLRALGRHQAVHLLDGGSDLVIMDGHDWHGNTARRSGASRLGAGTDAPERLRAARRRPVAVHRTAAIVQTTSKTDRGNRRRSPGNRFMGCCNRSSPMQEPMKRGCSCCPLGRPAATAPGPAANSLPRTTAPANRASTLRNSLRERLSTRRMAGTTLTLWQPVSLSLTMSG